MQWIASRNSFLPVVIAGVGSGVLLATTIDSFSAILLFVSFFVALCSILFLKSRASSVALLLTLLFVFGGLLGSTRAWMFTTSIPNELIVFENENVVIGGVVVADPDRRETSLRVKVRVTDVNGTNTRGTIIVSADRHIDIHYGSRIKAEGVLKKPLQFETDTGHTFDYPKFLLAHRVTHTMSFARVSVLEERGTEDVLGVLISVKNTLVENIERILPDPEAPLLAGLLLGERQSLGSELYTSFQKAGVVHMIVLSGYNVSLVVHALLKITELVLPRLASFSVAGLGIVLFALMTGASETTIRASLMAGVLILAHVLRRPHHALRALLIAGALMVMINPYLLLYDLSFQLSFLATGGIILFSDIFSKRFTFLPTSFGIRDIAGATIAAQLAVLPILVSSLGSVSVVSPVANILVLVAVPWAMLFGFIAILLAFVGAWIAYPFTIVSYALLTYILELSVWFGDLPFAAITIPPSGVFVASLLLLVLYGVLIKMFIKKNVLKLPLH